MYVPFVIKYQERVHAKSDFIISELKLINGEEEVWMLILFIWINFFLIKN